MKVNVTKLGGGLTRLEIEPSCSCEPRVIPTFVADDIMRDVVRREKNGCNCSSWGRAVEACVTRPVTTSNRNMGRPLPAPRGVESGFDAHIDRPSRENYGGSPWLADEAFRKDMAKYNKALNAVKACDWPCREDLNGVPSAISQHNPFPQTKFVGVPRVESRPATCGCQSDKAALRAAIGALAALVENM